MKRISALTIGILFLVYACQFSGEKKSEVSEGPNIIFILADDLGYGDLSCFGQDKFETPNIDALAANGMKFTSHYSGSTVCAPSRSSLLTGMHTGHTHIRGNKEYGKEGQEPLLDTVLTIPELLKSKGYVSGAFGKWGLGFPGSEGDPNLQGFDEFWGYNCQRWAHRYYPTHIWHNQEQVDLEGNDWTGTETYASDVIHKEALNFISDNKKKPFFLYLPYLIPHAELIVPDDSIFQSYKGKFEEKPYVGGNGADYGPNLRVGGYCSQEFPKATFVAMVARLDMYVGQVVDLLEKEGLTENTLIVFTSDNGPHGAGGAAPEYFNSNGIYRGKKRDLYEGGIRVAMIASWPGTIAKGSESKHVSAFWDMMPTFAELAGVEEEYESDGISMVNTLLGKGEQEEHKSLYWEFYERSGSMAVRMGDWKLVRTKMHVPAKTKTELFNMIDDPSEKNDVADDYPEKVEELMAEAGAQREVSEIFRYKFER